MALIHRTVSHFSTTKRHDNIIKLAKQLDNCPQLRLSIPKNITRVSTEHGMIIQLMWMQKPMVLCVQVNNKSPPLAGNEDWDTILECKGAFNMTNITSTRIQIENIFIESFEPTIQTTAIKKMSCSKLSLLDTQSTTRSHILVRT